MWTPEKVRKELPQVQVRVNGNILPGRVTGRLNEVATVTVDNHGTLHSGNKPWYDFHFAWKTIADVLNLGTPLDIQPI
jgi:hypothetical protein